jgi:site-specific DNA-cytosine methylase
MTCRSQVRRQTKEESRALLHPGPVPRLRRRFRSPSVVLMKGQKHLSWEILNPQNYGRTNNRQRIHMASHLHNTTSECPYDQSAARSQNRATLWWSDNIPDFQRPFPAPSSTKVVSMESVRHWISRVKDVVLKVPFEPPQG